MQNKTYNPAYDKQFAQYLRYDTPITEPYYLEDKVPQIYVWRTRSDDKVRLSHKQNNGKIFTRANPPHTGHPGTDYNCRCIAEPYVRGVTEYVNQTIISDIKENPKKWGNIDFWLYSYTSRGKTITLAETGHLNGLINYYFYHLGVMQKINKQIIQKGLIQRSGYFEYSFKNAYIFGGIEKYWNDREQYMYCFGGSTIDGIFRGYVTNDYDITRITGTIDYSFFDTFTDPGNIREKITTGTSDPDKTNRLWRFITDGFTWSVYNIIDTWTTRFEAEIPINKKAI